MFKSVTLELSLKPFKNTDSACISAVIAKLYDDWRPLLLGRDEISFMLYPADGSEILDYKGRLGDEFEWCKYIGSANMPLASDDTSPDASLHEFKRIYMENPPKMTYRILKEIIENLKKTGAALYPHAKISVGEVFDIGPEFAVSDFKYRRHNEVCHDALNGSEQNAFISVYDNLKGDFYPYAAFPDGVADGTPFSVFFGRQVKCFFDDMGFDFLWLSNGVGFSSMPWSATGAVFDGENFFPENFDGERNKIMDFWHSFRKECPDYPIRTRGTNYSAGIDHASNAVCLYDIYKGGFGITPPPNSPWAAIDSDFGLELMGHMSRIAEIPGDDFMFRFYMHDPWWANSPWFDRYNSQPHDIYLPMSLARIDERGRTRSAALFQLLSADNSFGEMPSEYVREVIPHILKAEKDAADEPSPFVWVYPFRESATAKDTAKLRKTMSGDWFICCAINDGFPLSTVVSCDNFRLHGKKLYAKSVVVTAVPDKDDDFSDIIMDYADGGGKVMFYGSAENAPQRFLGAFGISVSDKSGSRCEYSSAFYPDIHRNGSRPGILKMNAQLSDGTLDTVSDDENALRAGKYSVSGRFKNSVWCRGTIGGEYSYGMRHIQPYDGNKYVKGETLFRGLAANFGYKIGFSKPDGNTKSPVIMINKRNNAFVFSVYSHCCAVDTVIRFPLGAPILDAYEAEIKNGCAVYRFPKSVHSECRVFAEQSEGVVGVREIPPCSTKFRRRILVYGLENANVRFFCEKGSRAEAVVNSHGDAWRAADDFEGKYIDSEEFGTYYEVKNITGTVCFSIPY